MHVVTAKTQKEILDNVLVRGKVFIVEQQIDWEIEFDGLDDQSVLFTAYSDEKVPIGAARLYKNKVGRVATLKAYRKQGVATAIMNKIESYCSLNDMDTVVLHAQLYIKDFYENLGYTPQGNIFKEADIEHIKMIKKI